MPLHSLFTPPAPQADNEASSPYTSPYMLQAGPAPCHRRVALALRAGCRRRAALALVGCRRRAALALRARCRRRAALARQV